MGERGVTRRQVLAAGAAGVIVPPAGATGTLAASPLERAFLSPPAPADRTLVGAIRWDAWHTPRAGTAHGGEGGPVRAMERSLGPARYHRRLPFFARVVSQSEVSIGGYTQAIVDREIAFARAGGLDHWAFLLYEPGDVMSQGLELYLSSRRRRDMPFCVIAQANTFGQADRFRERMQRVVQLISEPGYVTVADGRPLLYLFDLSDGWLAAWGGREGARRLFYDLRAAVRATGKPDPYMVVLDFSAERGASVAAAIGADAISSYAMPGDGGVGGKPFAALRQAARDFWDACAATGMQVVPIAMAGWDRRPRVEHPVPWETWQRPGEGMDRFFELPTPAELAAHIEEAIVWTRERPAISPARTVLVYAWNEHDEGGWLRPTLGQDGRPDTSRLDALRAMRRGLERSGNR
ncbi:MAG TPA: hypothetical protein VLH79_01730 [Chthonomonadales bacterium]|nr:hypothetical protein [Chthonomonadales bacterium]